MSFWQQLKKPFFVMAPMADVTDAAFRALVAKRGAPDVFWTEFVAADGLYHTRELAKMPDAENPLIRDLRKSDAERPIVGQIFGSNPETIAYAAKLVAELGFDGVDLNMGCPDRSVEKQGAGAAMIKNPEVARAVIRAAKDAARDIHNLSYRPNYELPVSVKTRVGYHKEQIDEWIPAILAEKPDALTVHLRTRKEMSLVPARWELMPRVVALRDALSPETRIIGNGDVESVEQGRRLAEETGADGIMIGRGMFGNPWVFVGRTSEDTPLEEKLEALVELAHGFEALTPKKNFSILKKHIKAFVTGFSGAAELRALLMETNSAAELEQIIQSA